MSEQGLRVGIVGCGLIGRKRAEALRRRPRWSAASTSTPARRTRWRGDTAASRVADLTAVLDARARRRHRRHHPRLRSRRSPTEALEGGAHVLVEKPAGLGTAQIDA